MRILNALGDMLSKLCVGSALLLLWQLQGWIPGPRGPHYVWFVLLLVVAFVIDVLKEDLEF